MTTDGQTYRRGRCAEASAATGSQCDIAERGASEQILEETYGGIHAGMHGAQVVVIRVTQRAGGDAVKGFDGAYDVEDGRACGIAGDAVSAAATALRLDEIGTTQNVEDLECVFNRNAAGMSQISTGGPTVATLGQDGHESQGVFDGGGNHGASSGQPSRLAGMETMKDIV